MQNQYFGDVGDFTKYGLLRALQKTKKRLGVIWYLTPDGFGNPNDGRHVGYLEKEAEYRNLDSELFDVLRKAVRSGKRDVSEIERSGLLEPASFANEEVPSSAQRSDWFRRAAEKVSDSDLLFLDPDNGLEIGRPGPKHVLWAELIELANADRPRSLVVYQHRSRRRRGGQTFPEYYASECARRLPAGFESIALHCRRGASRLFLVLVHPEQKKTILPAVNSFIEKWSAGAVRTRMFEP